MAFSFDKSCTKYMNYWLQAEMIYLYTFVKACVPI